MTTKKGESRLLTPGEISMVTSLFKTAITVTSVRVYNDTRLPFQSKFGYAVTPRGAIYWPEDAFKEDYSVEDIWRIHWFIHEMTHVWQYQMGMCVMCRGVLNKITPYEYKLTPEKLLSDYNMEQQAAIISDYYLLDKYGCDTWSKRSKEKNKGKSFKNGKIKLFYWLDAYKQCLYLFLKNPKDKKALFG
ncbi:MAG: hypothetical protein J6589_08030 [Snodgrassella sp.]|uniref:hypothetical protein n=1 Tax=Snodgrassella sp. TaxID=2815304 RepID=UPI002585ACD7|nr:hypothetical protein [Snodgrassella sp.]MCO6514401.1 hypothetical protein [Snodgrassella sp.]MCO6520994.1 hypothetical protein [Snodgrassella sp.]